MIKVVVFNGNGKLFDVHSISALFERLYPGQGAAISTLRRDKQIVYT
jgi:2-haloacid dehalogenase